MSSRREKKCVYVVYVYLLKKGIFTGILDLPHVYKKLMAWTTLPYLRNVGGN